MHTLSDEDFRSEINRSLMNFNYLSPPTPRAVKQNSNQNKPQMFATIEVIKIKLHII